MTMFFVGDLLLGLTGPAHLLLVFFFVFCFAPAVGCAVWRELWFDAARREEVLRLAAFAAEESDRAEREAAYEYYAVSAAGVAAVAAAPKHQCAACFQATTTRCARCKTVRYWSPSLPKERQVENAHKLKEKSSSSCGASDGLQYSSVSEHTLASVSLNFSRSFLGSDSSSEPTISTLIANNTLKTSGGSPSLPKERKVENAHKLKENSSSSCGASDGLGYSSVSEPTLASVSLNFSRSFLGSKSSSEPPISTLIANNTLKTSMLKTVEKFKSPRLSKSLHSSPFVHETTFKSGFKDLFSYDLFSKLYKEKVDLFPCGLINCGNSCFANAILQCLIFTRPLTSYFLRGLHSKACTKKDWCFTCEFERLVWKVKQGKSPISPVEILSHINFGHGKEEDAHEFLRYAIDAMQAVCLMEVSNCAITPIIENTTLIQLIFGGYLKSKIKCLKCHGKSETTERMLDLTLEIHGDIGTLEDALTRFTSDETLDGDNKYRCGRCHSYEKARKRLTIAEAPNILTIALKRFQSGKFGKLNKSVRFPEILNLEPYMSASSDQSPVYSLYGVVEHLDVMNDAFSGHYVSYVRSGLGKWYKTDDSVVKPVKLDRVLSEGAYLLLYERRSPRAPSLDKNLLDHGSDGKMGKAFQAVAANNEDI